MTYLPWLKDISQESEQQKTEWYFSLEIELNLKYINLIDI